MGMTLGSLFDGAGGFPLAGIAEQLQAGIQTATVYPKERQVERQMTIWDIIKTESEETENERRI